MLRTLIATCVAAVVLGAFLFLNADGNHVYLVRVPLYSIHGSNFAVPSISFGVNHRNIPNAGNFSWIHGWPVAGLHRPQLVFKRLNGAVPLVRTSRWPFDRASWYHANYTALAINALIMTIVTIDAFLSTRRLLANRLRLSISTLLAILFIFAVVSSLRDILFVQLDWQERTAVFVVVVCILVTLIRFVLGSTRMVLNRFKRQKQEQAFEMN